MRSSCVIEFELPDRKSLDAAVEAVSHEGSVGGRSSAKVEGKDNMLTVRIEADDVVALRATANAFLRAMQVIEEVRK